MVAYGAAFCAVCGTPMTPAPLQASGPVQQSGPQPGPRPPYVSTVPPAAPPGGGPAPDGRPTPAAAGPPSRTAIGIIGVLGFIGLVGATGYKVAIHPGRVLPPIDLKVRAAGPPKTRPSEDEDDAEGKDPATRPPATRAPTKAPPAKGVPGTKTAPPAATKHAPESKKAEPEKKAEPSLGPPPSHAEIKGCIDKKKSRIRSCAEEAAQRMEFPGGGMATAKMNANGKFTNVHVPGGGYFAGCAGRVIKGLSCRAYKGEPIDVSYPMR
jgi:hypothetical protein